MSNHLVDAALITVSLAHRATVVKQTRSQIGGKVGNLLVSLLLTGPFSVINGSVFLLLKPPPPPRPKRILRSYPSLENTPFSRILDEKNTPFPTEIADFEAQ